MGKAFIDRTGHKYGRLVVRTFLGRPLGKTKTTWQCLCDCGNLVEITSSNLATGHTTSCGCLHIEVTKAKRIYALVDAPEYQVWRSIKQRTGSHGGKNHKWYSKISMCPEWRDSFETFLYDMGKRPSREHSIERLDSIKDYSPNNCVWATAKEQANNRSTNVLITYAGKTQTVAQWSEEIGIKQATLSARIRRGWSVDIVLESPLNTRIVNVTK